MRFISTLVIMMLATTLMAADMDFTGTWVLNRDKSELPDFGGQGGGRRGGGFAAGKMVITQKKNKMTVERVMTGRDGQERSMESTFDLSGKTTKDKTGRGTVENTATVKGNTLNVESVRVMERQGQEFEMTSNQTWTLAEDGKALIVETVMDTPMGERKTKTYYEKQ